MSEPAELKYVHVHNDQTKFRDELASLESAGWLVSSFDCSTWADEQCMHLDFKTKLPFPDYYGLNLDAMDEGLREMPAPEAPGRVLAFVSWEALSRIDEGLGRRSEPLGQLPFDTFESAGRTHAGFKQDLRFLVLDASPAERAEPLGTRISLPYQP